MKSREPLSSEDDAPEPMGKLQAAENSVFASRWELFTPYIAEFWGTLVITATFLCNVDVGHGTDPSFKSICHAFMVVGMVSATKHVTGSSLNPSVSLALALAGRQRLRTAGFLCIAQILGAITAVALCFKAGIAKDLSLGPHPGHTWLQVAVLEILYATMMCSVYLNCAASKKNNPKGDQNGFVGLAYGLCYLASHNAAMGVCSTVSNSAISIGLIVLGKSGSVTCGQGLGYFSYDLLGAFLAAGAYRVVRPQEFRSSVLASAIEENIQESALLAAEFMGTFFVVFTQVCTKMADVREHDMGPQAFGTAAAVISMVYALRDVSGAHFNPAVTLAVRSSGRTPAEEVMAKSSGDVSDLRFGVFYTAAQVLAGMLAAALAGVVHSSSRRTWSESQATAGQVMVAEAFGTFFLCYVVLGSSATFPVDGARSKQNNLSGMAYGSVVLATTLTVGNISGALMNPSGAVAVAMVGAISSRTSVVVFCVYHASAAVLAAAAFLLTHAQLYAKDARDADDLSRLSI